MIDYVCETTTYVWCLLIAYQTIQKPGDKKVCYRLQRKSRAFLLWKLISYKDLVWENLKSYNIQKSLGTPRTIKRYHPGTSMLLAV